MAGFAQPEDRFSSSNSNMDARTTRTANSASRDTSLEKRSLAEQELDSALQLLVERAQYITGATGTALALPQGDEMVCRASAGSSAPGIGARLQVVSGLTGESIERRQLLRCDNAETDPRVNLEACRSLGIASIVVLPLFRQSGEVRGLIELFSDHPYAFEERDLIALERMADLTMTALDLAEQQQNFATTPPIKGKELAREVGRLAEPPAVRSTGEDEIVPVRRDSPQSFAQTPGSAAAAAPAVVPEALRRIEKCASCGFPVSEGRSVCLDCEKKQVAQKNPEARPLDARPIEVRPIEGPPEVRRTEASRIEQAKTAQPAVISSSLSPSQVAPEQVAPNQAAKEVVPKQNALKQEEFVPAFLANAKPVQESWLSNHVNILAIIVLILGVLVAFVAFR